MSAVDIDSTDVENAIDTYDQRLGATNPSVLRSSATISPMISPNIVIGFTYAGGFRQRDGLRGITTTQCQQKLVIPGHVKRVGVIPSTGGE